MKIKEMHLDNFGIYQHIDWQPPQKGLIVMHGRNESGKTTLMKYVRSMLFGYPKDEAAGFSGRLDIRREDGKEFQIVRDEKKYYLTNGQEKTTEEPADLWWHGLDRQAYDKIFAMGLEDLQGVTILANESVRSHFFRVEGGVGLERARREVGLRLDALFSPSPQGKKPINVLITEQKDFERRVHGLAYDEEEFAKLQDAEGKSHEIENRIRLDIEEAKQQIDRVSLPINAWDIYQRGQGALKQMQTLADVSQFPADGAERWQDLVDKEKNIQEQLASLRQASRKEPAFQEAWQPWLTAAEKLDALYQKLGDWKQAKAEIDSHDEVKEAEKREKAEVALKAWTKGEEVPQAVDWSNGLNLASQLTQGQQTVKMWQASEPQAVPAPEKEAVTKANSTSDKTDAEWEAIGTATEALQHLVMERQKITDQRDWLTREPADVIHGLPVPSLAFAIAALFCLLAVYAGNFNLLLGWLGALICLGASGFFFWRQRHEEKRLPERLAKVETDLTAVNGKLRDAAEKAQLALPLEETNEQWLQAIEEVRRQYTAWQTKQSRAAWQKEQQEKYQALHQKWQDDGQAYAAKVKVQQAAWDYWCRQTGFPALAVTAVNTVKEAWDAWQRLVEADTVWQQHKRELEEKIAHLEEETGRVFQAVGEKGQPSLEMAEKVYQKWQDIRVKAEVAREQDRQQAERESQIKQLEAERKEGQARQQVLLAEVGVETEAGFRSKVLRYRQFQQYKEVYEQTEAHLSLIAKTPKLLSELRRELKTHTLKTWQDEREYYQKKINDAEKKLAQVVEKRGSVIERLSQMAKTDAYGKLLQEREIRKATLDADVDDWLTAMYTQYMLQQAQEYYERVRQPQVIQTASDYLSQMTKGRYTLQASVDGKQLYAVDGTQRRLPEKQWSSGLGDQIYLAIRLSLALSFAQQIEPLPLILDDIFVRFDEQRQKEALQFLASLGKEQQLFLFTCSEATNKLAREVQDELAGETDTVYLYEIEKGTIKSA